MGRVLQRSLAQAYSLGGPKLEPDPKRSLAPVHFLLILFLSNDFTLHDCAKLEEIYIEFTIIILIIF